MSESEGGEGAVSLIRQIANDVSRCLYDGKTGDPCADYNQSKDFQSGFKAGFGAGSETDLRAIEDEYELRGEPAVHSAEHALFREWKRGWHAGRWARIVDLRENTQ